jgi:beta-N-acetylhexosaminidase
MKLAVAIFGLLVALALLPFAVDWRSPVLCFMRPLALKGLIVLSLGVILLEVWLLLTSRSRQRALRVIGSLGLLAATLALTATLVLEVRFHWVRHQVLHADPPRLEKLGQHLIVGYNDLAEIRELVRLGAVGGVFLSTGNIQGKSVADIRRLTSSLQRIRRDQGLPLLWIATDQEGGIVSRLSPPLTHLPPLSEIVKRCADITKQERAVRRYANTQARGLAKVGVNLNLAPVVDLDYQIRNPDDRFTRIYERAISGDPTIVARVAGWYCAALQQNGVRCTLKHFPGLGRVFEDTHEKRAKLETSVEELSRTDWVPFRALMRTGNVFTMLSHVTLQSIDPDRPVSASPRVIAGLIRGAWNYEGVLITDNFTMQAMYRSRWGMEAGSVQALNAGVDLILISWDPDQYYRVMHALLKADRRGNLDPEALRRSHQRLARAAASIPHQSLARRPARKESSQEQRP